MIETIKRIFTSNKNKPINSNPYGYGVLKKKSLIGRANEIDLIVESYIRSAIRSAQSKIVGGSGIKVDSMPIYNGELDTETKEIIQRYWTEWCTNIIKGSKGETMTKLQLLAVESLFRYGELFIYRVDTATNHLSDINLSLQPLQSDSVSKIIRNSDTDIISYELNYGNKRIDANSIYHLRHYNSIDSERGEAILAPALPILRLIATLETSREQNYKTSSPLVGFIKTIQESANVHELDEELKSFIDKNMSMALLPYGFDFQKINPAQDNGTFQGFRDSLVKLAAGIIGVPASALSGNYADQNYSSLKKEANDERPFMQSIQQMIVDSFIRPLYRDFVIKLLIDKRITLKDGQTLTDIWQSSYTLPRQSSVDEYKEALTQKMLLELGLVSKSSVMQSMGLNPDAVRKQIAEDIQIETEMGIYKETLGGKHANQKGRR